MTILSAVPLSSNIYCLIMQFLTSSQYSSPFNCEFLTSAKCTPCFARSPERNTHAHTYKHEMPVVYPICTWNPRPKLVGCSRECIFSRAVLQYGCIPAQPCLHDRYGVNVTLGKSRVHCPLGDVPPLPPPKESRRLWVDLYERYNFYTDSCAHRLTLLPAKQGDSVP